ncbi:microtubule-associated tumor suppressor candidate 2 isoform X2 [Thunnus albacares]|uniref:microtubule-associated tumor suppressor candidate 2 isoform X2 n=1 Tax=Thunnus albacares TaxID=8236 RepID=UPI001CF692A4|nr:microtubule-associated tumor suppressor candidate 2 isoform X2 [Thunnus albacares]
MCEPFGQGELSNNNREDGELADGDANANDIRTEDGRRTGDTSTLSGLMTETADQDKVIIWGMDSQCDDPELAEFEMLECQELEAYLVEDGEDFVGLADREELQDQPSSCSKATVKQGTDKKSKEERKTILHGASEQESSHVSESREVSRTELSSETDVFVSCLSTISSMATAMDTAGRTQTTDSWHIASGPYSTISEDLTLASQTCNTISEREKSSQRAEHHSTISGKSTIHPKNVDMNLNSTVHSEDVISEAQVSNVQCKVQIEDVNEKHRKNNNQLNKTGNTVSLEGGCDRGRSTEHKALPIAEESNTKMDKSTQADEAPDVNYNPPKTGTKGTQSSIESKAIKKQVPFDNTMKKQNSFDKGVKKQPSFENTLKKQLSFDNTLKKQGSFENIVNSSSSSLERRKPWGSPSRPATPSSPKTTSCSPKRRPPGSPAKVQGVRALSLERSSSPQRVLSQTIKPPSKTNLSSGIPKPVMSQQREPEARRSSPPQKPKNVRPKIITYVRKNPQAKPQTADAPLEASTHPLRLSSYSSPPAHKDPKVGPQPKVAPVLCSSNLLFDKYRQEMQRSGSGLKPPSSTGSHSLSGKSDSSREEVTEKYHQEHVSQDGGSVYRSPRALRPQLGLGAVTRQPAAKTRVQQTGQRSAQGLSQSAQAAGASTQGHQDPTGEQRRSGPEASPKSLLLKPGQSGLRPPGFSALPAARLASFGFVRSSSVSSVSSNQSNDSSHSDPCRPSQHPSSGSDDTPLHKATAAPSESSYGQSRPQPPNAPSLQRRSLPPHCSPLASRKEAQKDPEAALPPKSSPKRFAVVSPKPQSPDPWQPAVVIATGYSSFNARMAPPAVILLVRGRTAAVHGGVRTERVQELDRALIQQLRERCEQQDLQLQSLQAQLKKASLCLDVFTITTQHFCHKNESAIVKERELSLELARIRDEVAFSVAHWEQLQQEKEELERRFEAELQGLRAQQQKELGALEERLKAQHTTESKSLQAQQRAELEELRVKQQEQIEEMFEDHEESLMEMETAHNDTLATLQEEHARTVKNLKMAHEQQKKSLEEEFEKIRLSLQDQVDTLTFQNHSLRDRAKRFEEALRKSTDEQIVDALAPYQHIEEDLKSLKEVLEMKNQQIHQQELKITELEKIAEKNVYLEERVQVLQQQNEDLKERIDKNLAVSRQLSEENANLQVNVEKESNEKKRLSRTNEELLWRLQTGELSPRMSPSSSPIHRPPSGPGSPARPHSYHQ